MALKKRISYHWRLFLPLAALIGTVVGILVWYQYKREADYRLDLIQKELSLVNSRIVYAYQADISLHQYLNFLSQYYKGSMYENLRISIYDGDGVLMYSRGTPIDPSLDDKEGLRRLEPPSPDDPDDEDSGLFYYTGIKTHDGQVDIKTAMPYTKDVDDALSIDPTVWSVILLLLGITLTITFLYTRSLSKSVTLLNVFAQRAVTGAKFDTEYNFPHNELGDISREIITLYRERGRAIELITRERKVAMHAIEEKIATSRQITNNINHEIKTPVGIIKGYLETILANPDMDPESRKRFLERMLLNVDRLCTLLNDVSTMTRLENGAGKIPVEKVDMHDLAYQIESDIDASHISGNMHFSFSIPFDCCVKGNYNLLNGMICGLIRNSAMHSGGTEIGFKLISESDRFYVFSFYDNGTGVGEEHITHLFERFYRVDTGRSRKMGGTGLGLPIVKSTILSLGGTISVHNRSTGGLEFIFTLPKWE